MKHSAQDNAEGTMLQVKGVIKEVVGEATNDNELIVDGKFELLHGRVQETVGQIKKLIARYPCFKARMR